MNASGVLRGIVTPVRQFGMSSSAKAPVLEGVFAINKPSAITSAQVIRDAQRHFDPSRLFRPWLDREQARKDAESHNQRQKRKWRGRRITSVKMGHGGTLDPMATGVLILGLGSGTKQLHSFSNECTKSYETIVLFGASTDTYDDEGKIIDRKAFSHITKEAVEEALVQFRGKILQKPPIFSALRVQGKRLYEYAREGKEVPIEIQSRPVEVHDLEVVEWIEGGTHQWQWPKTEAAQDEKQVVEMVSNSGTINKNGSAHSTSSKRKRAGGSDEQSAGTTDPVSPKKLKADSSAAHVETPTVVAEEPTSTTSKPETVNSSEEAAGNENTDNAVAAEGPDSEGKNISDNSSKDSDPCPAPACRIRMTVTSGFYVRSLCHDLGAAVGSLGIMVKLVRTRQGQFELGKNVLQYDDLEKGEDVWGPQVKGMLESWSSEANEDSA